jgi:RND family efflux transporter MFP subunit
MSSSRHGARRAPATVVAVSLAVGLATARADIPAPVFDCLIEPSAMVEIRSPVVGLIEKVHVNRGDRVQRGATVVTLDASVERAAAELARYRAAMEGPASVAQARLAYAERKLKRKANLAEEKFTSVQDRDDAEAERDIARAEAETAREQRRMAALEAAYSTALLGQRTIKSPVDGVVVERQMQGGELAEPSEARNAIVKIAQIDPLRVRLILPGALHRRVKLGMAAQIAPEAPLDAKLQAKVGSIDRVIDAASGTFQVRLDLPNPNGRLPAGAKCKATLVGL